MRAHSHILACGEPAESGAVVLAGAFVQNVKTHTVCVCVPCSGRTGSENFVHSATVHIHSTFGFALSRARAQEYIYCASPRTRRKNPDLIFEADEASFEAHAAAFATAIAGK